MIRLKSALTALITAACVFAAPPMLDTDTLVTMALEHSPDLNISRAALEAARQNTRRAVAGYLPRIDLSASAGSAGVKNDAKSTRTDQSGTLIAGTLSASQLLLDFGKTSGAICAASFEADASYEALSQAVSDKIYDVKRAYYDALRAQSLIRVNRENVTLNEQQLHRAERYFAAGIRTKIDVTDARVNLIDAQLKLQDAEYELRRARIALERVVGTAPYGGNYTLQSIDANTSDLYGTLPPIDQPLDALEAFAYAHRPTLRQYADLTRSAEAGMDSAAGNYLPSIALQASYTRNATDEALELYFPEQQWGAGVGLQWNLFEGMRSDATYRYARAEVIRSRAVYNDMKLRIQKEVADAHTMTLKRHDGVKLSQSLAEAAREKFVQARKRYEYGLSDYIELQQARQGYINAASSLVVHYYDFYIALARRDRATGK